MKNALDVLREIIRHIDNGDLIVNPKTLPTVEDRIPITQTLAWAHIRLEQDSDEED